MDSLIKKSGRVPSPFFPGLKGMMPHKIKYKPIGIIHSPFRELSSIPRQPEMGHDIEGVLNIFPEYAEGLDQIEKFMHLTLVYHLHKSQRYDLRITRPGEGQLRGVFSTRSPNRPNPIGISVVRLMRVEGSKIIIRDLDILDGTPLLDIKPYLARGH